LSWAWFAIICCPPFFAKFFKKCVFQTYWKYGKIFSSNLFGNWNLACFLFLGVRLLSSFVGNCFKLQSSNQFFSNCSRIFIFFKLFKNFKTLISAATISLKMMYPTCVHSIRILNTILILVSVCRFIWYFFVHYDYIICRKTQASAITLINTDLLSFRLKISLTGLNRIFKSCDRNLLQDSLRIHYKIIYKNFVSQIIMK
jgi:hypothetical protein